MGFFGDLKQDLSHAVNELIPDEKKADTENITAADEPAAEILNAEETVAETDIAVTGDQTGSLSDTEYENLLEEALAGEIPIEGEAPAEDGAAENASEAESALDSVFADMEAESLAAAATAAEESVSIEEPVYEDINIKGADVKMDSNTNYSDETSVITLGMTVNGDISTEGSLEILGNVKGNIDVTGKLNITGHVTGNSKAHEIFAENAKITGDISSESSIKIGAGTVIVGNITGFSAAVAGAVKGDIDVHGPVILDSSAIVMGNIRSKSVQINNGAAIEGMCSQCYADVSPTSFFDDYKPETIGKKGKSEKNDK